jgi:hypothetical protein
MAEKETDSRFYNVSVNGQWLRLAQGHDGSEFYNVTLYPGTKTADGRDLSFGEFTVPAKNVFPDRFNEDNVVIGIPIKAWDAEKAAPSEEDRVISVKVPQIDEKTKKPVRDENGVPVPAGEPVKITAKEVTDAIKAHDRRDRDFTTVNINGKWVRELQNKTDGNRFFVVTLPPGTKVGGGTIDVSYGEFMINPKFVHADNFNANNVNISLANRKWDSDAKASTDEKNLITVKVPQLGADGKPVRDESGARVNVTEHKLSPQVIRSAVIAQKQAYRESLQEATRAVPVADRVQAPKFKTLDEKGAKAEQSSRSQGAPKKSAPAKTRPAEKA